MTLHQQRGQGDTCCATAASSWRPLWAWFHLIKSAHRVSGQRVSVSTDRHRRGTGSVGWWRTHDVRWLGWAR